MSFCFNEDLLHLNYKNVHLLVLLPAWNVETEQEQSDG